MVSVPSGCLSPNIRSIRSSQTRTFPTSFGHQLPLLILLTGAGAFYLTRFLLGSCESGFIPASLYTISRFYKRDETSKRFSWFFIGNHFATAVSGFIAYVSRLLSSMNRSKGSQPAEDGFLCLSLEPITRCTQLLMRILQCRASYNCGGRLRWQGGNGCSL